MPVRVEQFLQRRIKELPPAHPDKKYWSSELQRVEQREKPPRLHTAVLLEGKLYHGFEVTQKFLERAHAEGAHLRCPTGVPEERWARRKETVDTYYNTDTTYQELGEKYGITKEAIRQKLMMGMRNLWSNCSSDTQQLIPIHDIELDKPLSQKRREQRSKDRGGVSRQAARLAKQGATYQQIKNELSLSKGQTDSVRRTLRAWGEDLPLIRPRIYPQLRARLEEETRDEKIQQLLDQISVTTYMRYFAGENPLTISIKKAASEFHFRPRHTRLFVQALRKAGVPVGEIAREVKTGPQKGEAHYYFLLKKHQDRASKAFLENETLQQFL